MVKEIFYDNLYIVSLYYDTHIQQNSIKYILQNKDSVN